MTDESIYEIIAKKHNVSAEYVKQQMQAVVEETFANTPDVPVPSVEEFILFAASFLLKNKNH